MRYLLPLLLVVLIIQTSVAPPIEKKNEDHKDTNEVDDSDDLGNPEYQMEYHRYLKEVVQALESDPEFRAKLEKAHEDDIRTGKIAHELQFVNHKVRTKLDELKREELERLRHLATKEHNLINGLDIDHLKIAEHLDHSNAHTFEIDDLKKLIAKTTKDLADADKRRRQQFKEYEMQKKFEEEQKMKDVQFSEGLKEEERKKYEEELEAMKKKHKDHKPLHHPGSKQQLEEVWEKQDHMEAQEFDPKTFFYLHDLDGNGFWDQDEVKALFLKELDKLYTEGAPEDDTYERREEMERMREHVFNEADLNHDGLISYEEFLEQTKKPDFQQDEGWQGLDEQQIYSQQEYEAFQRQRAEEIQKIVSKAVLPPSPDTAHLPVQHEQFPPQYQQYDPQYHPQGQLPPQPVGHVPQYQGQLPQQQYQPQVPPPQQHYPSQIPQHQQYQGQQPQYQVPVPQQPQFQPQQVHQQFQGQPQQVQQQAQIKPQQVQQQNLNQPQQVQQQIQNQPQQAQQQIQQQQIQNQVPQNTQGNVPSSSHGAAQVSHNLPQQQDLNSAKQQINQNSIPNI
ncbi:PREDICTED: nucleobindin-2 isoform X2 [Vollenhovia emeryi]|uniref:nucleobindin-2 isoform X2 n=1 Tax=Vollenhovia emeryi TaxID=411798 RepID=UPI0005F4657D|nr:PREDICTED: nucleobindin-2 isoform X2 [Vollenhovia emeryi]